MATTEKLEDGTTAPQPLVAFLEQPEEFLKACTAIYKPLDTLKSQIRLVHIQPAAESDDIHLSLEIVSLDDQPKFHAISYTWGSRSPTAQVYLENHVYNVTQNQYEALRRFRQIDSVQTMWMDVICINEDDVVERSSQVSMMSRIYSASQQTQIWLGEFEPESVQGFTDDKWATVQAWVWEQRNKDKMTDLVRYGFENEEFSHRAEMTAAFDNCVNQPDGLVHGAFHILKLLGSDTHLWELPSSFLDSTGELCLNRRWFESMQTLKAILCKPYWRRVWTVQEAVLSPADASIHIGKYAFPMSSMLELGKHSLQHAATSVACCDGMYNMIMYEDDALDSDTFLDYIGRAVSLHSFLRHLESGKLDFAEALELSNKLDAFDARDYVYGVLGFVDEDMSSIVDYSLNVSKVYQAATVLCWKARGSLGWLKKGRLECEGRTPGLPTWCIDFTNSQTLSFEFYESFFENEPADWDNVDVDIDNGSVTIDAFALGSVKSVFERAEAPWPSITDENLKIMTDWASRIKEAGLESNTEINPETNKAFFKRFFDLIFRDTVFDMEEGEAQIRRITDADWDEIEYWWSIASYGSAVNDWDMDRQNEARPRIRRKSLAFYLGLADSMLAVTSNDQLSLVPLTAQPGDQLFHITGCCMPLILREVKSETDDIETRVATISLDKQADNPSTKVKRTFRLVGPCYVKGLMGSQGFENLQSEKITLM